MAKNTDVMVDLASPEISGVRIRHHVLDTEASRLARIVKRVGIRLRNILIASPTDALPDEEVLGWAKWYQAGVLGLLKEHRERARLAMQSKAPQLSEEEYEKELDQLAAAHVRAMPQEVLDALVRERAQVSRNVAPTGEQSSVSSTADGDIGLKAGATFDLSDEEP